MKRLYLSGTPYLRAALLLFFSAMLAQNPAGAESDDWYPASIAMPGGLNYPCALTALPRNTPGIPRDDSKYINHVYAMILKCVQAKTAMLAGLQSSSPTEGKRAYARYYFDTSQAAAKIRLEPTPNGLETFRNQVLQAINLQVAFFNKAKEQRQAGKSVQEIMSIPEGQQASGQLQAAWQQMAARYPTWSNETKDSIYHHLCALDLF